MKDRFSSLYAFTANKDASFADYREQVSGSFVWSPVFVGDAFVHDLTLVSFLSMLNGITIQDSSHDSSSL